MKGEKIYYILLKTHNVTGKKYLCKHVSCYENSCYKYTGSGVYWKRHIAKHGDDIGTEILARCKSAEEVAIVGLEFSNKFNVVESNDYANLIPENGQGGAEPVKFRKKHTGWRGLRFPGESNHAKRPEVREKISKALKGRKFTKEWKNKLSESRKGKEPWNKGKPCPSSKTDHMNIIVKCPHCNKDGGKGAMIRWHFDNCKEKKT